jgi:hypothetical protein
MKSSGPVEVHWHPRLGAQFQERKHELKTSLLQRGIRAAKQAARKIA